MGAVANRSNRSNHMSDVANCKDFRLSGYRHVSISVKRFLVAPFFVAGPDVGDTQVKEAIHSVEIRGCFKEHLWLVRSGATAGIQDDPGVSELDVAGTVRLD